MQVCGWLRQRLIRVSELFVLGTSLPAMHGKLAIGIHQPQVHTYRERMGVDGARAGVAMGLDSFSFVPMSRFR